MDHDKDRTLGERVDVRVAAAAGEAQFRLQVVADAGGVDIAVLVDLRPAEVAEIDIAALGDGKGIEQTGGTRGPGFATGVADRGRQFRGPAVEGSGLENQFQVGGMGLLRQHDGHHGQTGTGKNDLIILHFS